MKIEEIPYESVDWAALPPVEHKGDSGTSYWRTYQAGNIRARVVEYSAGFCSDHWCERGHVLIVIEGELKIRMKDSREYCLRPGAGFCASDGLENAHLAYSDMGARVFIVD
jgi:hypothetical protein